MRISLSGRISQWGIVAACMAGLAGCGAADQRARATTSAGVAAAPQALPTTRATTTTGAAALPTANAGPTAVPAPLPTQRPPPPTLKETLMPEPPSPQPPDAAQPTLQAATLAPSGQPAEVAKADLARRRSVAPDTITVVEVRDVVWPDGGMGCPRPGMAYKQVPVDGLLIRLESGGQIFEYHSGGGKPPFLCEQPSDMDKATPVSDGEGR